MRVTMTSAVTVAKTIGAKHLSGHEAESIGVGRRFAQDLVAQIKAGTAHPDTLGALAGMLSQERGGYVLVGLLRTVQAMLGKKP